MGRSGAAKNKKMRENRQEVVQKILAGKIFYDMSWDGAFLWETLLSDKNGDVDFGDDYGISRKEAIEKLKLSVQVSLHDPVREGVKKQARKSSEDTHFTEYAQFEKV